MDKTTPNSVSYNNQTVSNWGRFPSVEAHVFQPNRPSEIRRFCIGDKLLIARGNGRSYGDSSLQENIVSTNQLNRFISFNTEKQILVCESGVLLGEILNIIVPKGFFLPVVPGTQFISLGGAVAANVHGKNHYNAGSIAKYILSLDLINDEGKEVHCSPTENFKTFAATIGGMGLTGVITKVSLQLCSLPTAYIEHKGKSFKDLETLALQLLKPDIEFPYSVAWIDGLSKIGRGVLLSGRNCSLESLPSKYKESPLAIHSDQSLNIPPLPTGMLLNRPILYAYNNWQYYLKFSNKTPRISHYSSFFFPLDQLRNWNRLYGPKGLLQYQFVLPIQVAITGLSLVWKAIQSSSCRPYLVVLKAMGADFTPVSTYSFPMEGLSLALDFKVSPDAFKLLDILDEIIIAHHGRVYLAKDARMKAKTFQVTYPKADLIQGKYQSLQSQRLQNHYD